MNCFECVFVILLTLLSIGSWCLGIYEAIGITEYKMYITQPGYVWEFCVGACCVDFLMPIIVLVSLPRFLADQQSNSPFLAICAIEFALIIWAIVTYYINYYYQYIDFWTEKALPLMISLDIHYGFVVLIPVSCMIACIMGHITRRGKLSKINNDKSPEISNAVIEYL